MESNVKPGDFDRLVAYGKDAPVAHMWNGVDTACRCYSVSSAATRLRYRPVADHERLPICMRCRNAPATRPAGTAA